VLHGLYEETSGIDARLVVEATVGYFQSLGNDSELLLELLKSVIDREIDSTGNQIVRGLPFLWLTAFSINRCGNNIVPIEQRREQVVITYPQNDGHAIYTFTPSAACGSNLFGSLSSR